MKKMAAGSFKANCLAVMDEEQAKHETVVITKRGKPVAKRSRRYRDRRNLQFSRGQGSHHRRCPCTGALVRGMGRTRVILLDTHVVVWLAFEPARISRKGRTAIDVARRNADGLAISDITLLELSRLASKGRIRVDISLESFLQEVESRFVVLPITGRACALAVALPATYPKDPADRIIGATALVEGISLLTADLAIRRSQVIQTIW